MAFGKERIATSAIILLCAITSESSGVLAISGNGTHKRQEEELDCTIEGDEGLYGIGVRLGIYFQVFASMFTLAFQSNQGPAFLYAAAALQAALFVALAYASAREDIHSAEALVAILLLIIMILFECLVFASIFMHLLSGHFRLAKTDHTDDTFGVLGEKKVKSSKSSKTEDNLPAVDSSNADDTIRSQDETPEKKSENSDDNMSIRSSATSNISLTRQKTRLPPQPEQAKLNLREAIYASDPLLISDDNLILIARTVKNYAESHVWASAVFISLLIFGSYIYMMWFWWRGVFELRHDECGTYGFFIFASFEVEHWIRWPVRLVLILFGIFLLGFLLQSLCAIVGFSIILLFQSSERVTTWLCQKFSSIQKMNNFYDRVTALGLPLMHEYMILVMVYKSFLSHWPDRLCLSIFGKDPQKTPKKKATTEGPDLDVESSSLKKVNGSLRSEERTIKRKRSRESPAESEENSQDLPDENSKAESEGEKALRLHNGEEIKQSEFFRIGNPPGWRFLLLNRVAFRLLNPRPSQISDSTRRESPDSKTYIMPYADNFETLAVPSIVIIGHITYFLGFGVLLAAGIWSVELTLRKNHIAGVHHLPSTAQLIPFIIGAGSFVQSGLSALGGLGAWLISLKKLKRGSKSWFDALVERYFYEVDSDEGGINVEHIRHFPAMLIVWMLFPSMHKGQSIGNFRKEFTEEMNQRGGLFVLDLFD